MLMTTDNMGRWQCQLSRHYNADCFSCKEQEPNSERLYRWNWTKIPPSLRSDQCYCTPVSGGVWCTVDSVFLVHHSSQIVVLESHRSVQYAILYNSCAAFNTLSNVSDCNVQCEHRTRNLKQLHLCMGMGVWYSTALAPLPHSTTNTGAQIALRSKWELRATPPPTACS